MFLKRSVLLFFSCILIAACQPESTQPEPTAIPQPTVVPAIAQSAACSTPGLTPEECANSGTHQYDMKCSFLECTGPQSCGCGSTGVKSADLGDISETYSFSSSNTMSTTALTDNTLRQFSRVSPNTWNATFTDSNPRDQDTITITFSQDGASVLTKQVDTPSGAHWTEQDKNTLHESGSSASNGSTVLQPDFSSPQVCEGSAQLSGYETYKTAKVCEAIPNADDVNAILKAVNQAADTHQCWNAVAEAIANAVPYPPVMIPVPQADFLDSCYPVGTDISDIFSGLPH